MQASVYRRSRRKITLRHYVIAIVALLILPACNSETSGDPSPGDPPSSPVFGARVDCTTVSEGPDDLAAVDTEATPRADGDAEILALEVSGEFIAPEALYQRIQAELTGLRATFPGMAHIEVRGCSEPGGIIVHFTVEGRQQVNDGTYTAWDDFNANLRLTSLQTFPTVAPHLVALHFEGRYNANRLAAGYSRLPEVTSVEPNVRVGDSPDICLAERQQVHFYIFRDASGDCPSGCIDEGFVAATVDASGNIATVGEWDGSGGPPQWFAAAEDCRAFL